MDEYISKLQEEIAELDKRHKRLHNFICFDPDFEGLTSLEKILMEDQVNVMAQYLGILKLRLEIVKGDYGTKGN